MGVFPFPMPFPGPERPNSAVTPDSLSAPVNTSAPAIAGTPTEGSVITSSTGVWSGNPVPTYAYQWRRAGVAISGATNSSYTVVSADVGQSITVTVTATNSQGSASATSAAVTGQAAPAVAPTNSTAPAISGTPQVDLLLTASTGVWSGSPTPTYTYQWNRAGVAISGQTSATYTVVTADIGQNITVTVTATNTAGSASATSAAVVGQAAVSFSPASLFASGEQGVWYDPSDFSTMFQDAAGTTPVTAVEQPVGLILDKSKGLTLGPELATSPDLSWNASAAADTANLAPVVSGLWYRFQWTGLSTASTTGTSLRIGATLLSPNRSITSTTPSSGVQYFQATATGNLLINATTNASNIGSYSSVSVREIAGNHANQATDVSRPVLSARYNRFLYSEQFDNAAWVKNGGTITANAIAAPDGTLTADLFTVDTTNGQHRVYQLSTSTSTGTNTFLIYVKPNGINYVTLRVETVPNYGVMVNLLNGTTTTGRYDGTSATTDFTNIVVSRNATTGWVSISGQFPGSGGINAFVYLNQDTTTSTFTGNGTSGVYLWGADIRSNTEGSVIPVYQRVESSTVYDLANFPCYLRFDGTDDGLSSNPIDFTSTDKLTFFSGVRKLNDAATGTIIETSTLFSSNPGSFQITGPGAAANDYRFYMRGDTGSPGFTATTFTAPITNVLSCRFDIAGVDRATEIFPRVNGAIPTLTPVGGGFAGAGNFGNYTAYIGWRGTGSSRFNGRLYGLIVVGRTATTTEITNTEAWVNGKTGAY